MGCRRRASTVRITSPLAAFNHALEGLIFFSKTQRQMRRYEVEVQLGPTDEAHIIRTIEYWDIERNRYPQYEHCAVLIATNSQSPRIDVSDTISS